MRVKVELIRVPEDRHRKVFDEEKIRELAKSLSEYGLIEPIVVDSEFNLIAGERRLRAAKLLGWEEIEVQMVSELDDWKKRAIELEENIRRENLSWQEEVRAKALLHKLYQERHGTTRVGVKGGWSLKKTSELLGESEGKTAMDVKLGEALEHRPELWEMESKVAAYLLLRTKEVKEAEKEIAKIIAEDSAKRGEEPLRLILGDAREELRKFPNESFDFCVTDPPYAVELGDSVERWWGNKWIGRVYEDRYHDFSMHEEVFKELYRVLKPRAHCYVFFATTTYTKVGEALSKAGFSVRKKPLLWVKTPVTAGPSNNPYFSYGDCYETIFFCTKGDARAFNKPGITNAFLYPIPSNKIHPTERPVELLCDLISNCSLELEIGIDPFAGSGSFLRACKALNRRGVGIEKEEGYYLAAYKRLFGTENGSKEGS